MAFEIPQKGDRIFRQDNHSDIYGNVWATFNVDFTDTLGKAKVTRSKLVTSSDDEADLEIPVAFAFYDDKHWAITDDFVYEGGKKLSDAFNKNTDAGDLGLVEGFSDMTVFNNKLYISSMDTGGTDTELYSNDGTSTWSKVVDVTDATSNSPALLQSYANRLYFSTAQSSNVVVTAINKSNAVATGSNRLDTGYSEDDYVITMLEAGENGLWIGLTSRKGGDGVVLFWDGEDEDSPARRFSLGQAGVIAGTMSTAEQVPYFVDTRGRLMKFNGAGFAEVARFPLEGEPIRNAVTQSNTRAIHPNGVTEIDGNILILINNEIKDSDSVGGGSIKDRMPSGVWEYNSDHGLYHKYSLSYSETGDTGTTNLSDYGQVRLRSAGALYASSGSDTTERTGSGILFGAQYSTDNSTTKYGIFTDDTDRTTQALGHIITPQLFANDISDTWQYVYARFKKFLDSGDKMIIKARTEWTEAAEVDVNWVDTDTFTTTGDLSTAAVGDEVEVTLGTGSGFATHIAAISESASTYTVDLEDTVTGATGTGKARVTKFRKLGEFSNQYTEIYKTPIEHNGVWVQIKVIFISTGDNELYDFTVTRTQNEKKEGQ